MLSVPSASTGDILNEGIVHIIEEELRLFPHVREDCDVLICVSDHVVLLQRRSHLSLETW